MPFACSGRVGAFEAALARPGGEVDGCVCEALPPPCELPWELPPAPEPPGGVPLEVAGRVPLAALDAGLPWVPDPPARLPSAGLLAPPGS